MIQDGREIRAVQPIYDSLIFYQMDGLNGQTLQQLQSAISEILRTLNLSPLNSFRTAQLGPLKIGKLPVMLSHCGKRMYLSRTESVEWR